MRCFANVGAGWNPWCRYSWGEQHSACGERIRSRKSGGVGCSRSPGGHRHHYSVLGRQGNYPWPGQHLGARRTLQRRGRCAGEKVALHARRTATPGDPARRPQHLGRGQPAGGQVRRDQPGSRNRRETMRAGRGRNAPHADERGSVGGIHPQDESRRPQHHLVLRHLEPSGKGARAVRFHRQPQHPEVRRALRQARHVCLATAGTLCELGGVGRRNAPVALWRARSGAEQ